MSLVERLEQRIQFMSLPATGLPGVSAMTLTRRGTLGVYGTRDADLIDVVVCARRAVGSTLVSVRNATLPSDGKPFDELRSDLRLIVITNRDGRAVAKDISLATGEGSAAILRKVNPFSDGQWIFIHSAVEREDAAILVSRSLAKRIAVDAGAGRDTLGQGEFFLDADLRNTGWVGNLPATLMGGRGDDFLRGGGENDVFSGGDGKDFLLHLGGSAGPVRLVGGNGDDSLYNESSDCGDILRGGKGLDISLYPESDTSGIERTLNPQSQRAQSQLTVRSAS